MKKTPDEEKLDKIKTLIEEICNSGRLYLRVELQRLGEYPVIKYDDKNKHITPEIESIGRHLLLTQRLNLLETFWLNITGETDKINQTRVNKLNRGISLGNTGVSQIAQTKVDEGIFNLYRALADDEAILKQLGLDSDPEKNLVNTILFSQFEDPMIEKIIISALKPNLSNGENLPSLQELKEFFKKQKPSKRLFLFEKIGRLFSSIRRNKILPNMMTRQAILDSLSSFCLWIEDSLRGTNPSLKDLSNGLHFLSIPSWKGGYGSVNLDELVDKILIAEKNNDIKIKRALVVVLIRNYSSHNLETKEHPFFESEEKIYSYVADIFFTALLLQSKGKL